MSAFSAFSVFRFYPAMPFRRLRHRLSVQPGVDDTPMRVHATAEEEANQNLYKDFSDPFHNKLPFRMNAEADLFLFCSVLLLAEDAGLGVFFAHGRGKLPQGFLLVAGEVFRHGNVHRDELISSSAAAQIRDAFPRRRNTAPGCVPSGIVSLTFPSSVGTSTSAPRTAWA